MTFNVGDDVVLEVDDAPIIGRITCVSPSSVYVATRWGLATVRREAIIGVRGPEPTAPRG